MTLKDLVGEGDGECRSPMFRGAMVDRTFVAAMGRWVDGQPVVGQEAGRRGGGMKPE